MVTEVTEANLRVSLAHGVEETVRCEEASDVLSQMLQEETDEGKLLREINGAVPQLTELFVPGQYVRGTYVLDKEEQIEFSLKLSQFYNTVTLSKLSEGSLVAGCVRTLEDHGYTVSFGIKV